MKKLFGLYAFIIFVLVACATTPPTATEVPQVVESTATRKPTKTPVPPPTNRSTHTPTALLLPTETFLPTNTPTTTPIFSQDGVVTWHPKDILIEWSDTGGDGGFYEIPPQFVLFWDGTLYLANNDESKPPYVSKLTHDQVCTLLNTANKSGFLDEKIEYYEMPFDGAGGSGITVNAWKEHYSASQAFYAAVAGRTYDSILFCRNCPVPSEGTIIRPPFANLYFLLRDFIPDNRKVANADRVLLYLFEQKEDENAPIWPVGSISLDNFWNSPNFCAEGILAKGDEARQIMQKVKNGQFYRIPGNNIAYQVIYRPLWPFETSYCESLTATPTPQVPPNSTISCKTNSDTYSILPLNPENKFWYYAPSGKWGAEVVTNTNQLRVVNKYGYEKIYQYDPELFNRETIQFYPNYWSKDDKFLYVNILPGSYKPNTDFANSIGIQQIDVQAEKIKYIFIGTQKQEYSYSFSSDYKKIAYIRQGENPLRISINDTYTGEEKTLSLPSQYSEAGSIFWSLDDQKIYLAAIYNEDEKQKTHILALDSSNLANLEISFEALEKMKLKQDFDRFSAQICPIDSASDSYCSIDLYLETGTIIQH